MLQVKYQQTLNSLSIQAGIYRVQCYTGISEMYTYFFFFLEKLGLCDFFNQLMVKTEVRISKANSLSI